MKKSPMMLVALVVTVFASRSAAQDSVQRVSIDSLPTGRIVGRVIDASSGVGISDASIQVVGADRGTQTGVDGRYSIAAAPAGTVTLHVRRIGYGAKTVTGILLEPGKSLEQNISLVGAVVQLETSVVTASVERGSVNAALDRERTATGVVNSVTSEQISKSPDRDAAQAMQRVSGVTVSDGRYVFVRGLGERYTNTSLNGAALPSPEPERRVVSLDMFPSALIQSVTTSKTFTPDQSGDFTGAQVNIETREFPTGGIVTMFSSVGVNSLATGKAVPGTQPFGLPWLGIPGSERSLPTIARATPTSAFGTSASQEFVQSIRNVWAPISTTGAANRSFGASAGGQASLLRHPVTYVLSASYGLNQEIHSDELRQLVVGGGNATVRAYNTYRGATGRTNTLWGGIGNFSTMLGSRSRLAFNNIYNHSADNEAHADEGFDEQLSTDPTARTSSVRRSWLDFVERTVRSNQIKAEHSIGSRVNLDWNVTSSEVTRWQPDHTDLFYMRQSPTDAYFLPNDPKSSRRLYAYLDETVLNPGANLRLAIGPEAHPMQLKVGTQVRSTHRNAALDAYLVTPSGVTQAQLEQQPDSLFSSLATAGQIAVQRDPDAGYYKANDRVSAGYGMIEIPVTSRINVIGGARVEGWRLDLRSAKYLGERFDSVYNNTDVLPSLSMNIRLGESQNLRLAATRTISRPEYRELSTLQEKGPIGDLDFVGNPSLQRAMINNYDARWEMYPQSGEILSVGVFAKRFDHPIEKVQISTNGGNIYSFVNASSAQNFGLELEARKHLGSPFTVFSNVTLMKSKIVPGNTDISALTSADRPMVGQAPYVVNAGLSYENSTGALSATALYNVVGRRITATGTRPTPDTYLEPRNLLDFSLRFPLWATTSAKVNASNLLNAEYKELAGGITRLSYRTGRVFSFGLSWTPQRGS
ncbi:MAG TPA: outer membrane beta-barrel protein [Gemmatimonadaceae bacterium]|nr:outer membrane beta-barrel protein [Gemmatimonadaceae bacterium]